MTVELKVLILKCTTCKNTVQFIKAQVLFSSTKKKMSLRRIIMVLTLQSLFMLEVCSMQTNLILSAKAIH